MKRATTETYDSACWDVGVLSPVMETVTERASPVHEISSNGMSNGVLWDLAHFISTSFR